MGEETGETQPLPRRFDGSVVWDLVDDEGGESKWPACGVRRPSSTYSCLRPEGHDGEHRSHLSSLSYAYWRGTDGVVGYRSLPMPGEDIGSSGGPDV